MPYARLQDNGSERKSDGDSGADSSKPADNDGTADNDGAADGDRAADNNRTADSNKTAVRYGNSVSVKYADGDAGDGTDRSTDEGANACSDGAGAADSGTDSGAKRHTVREADKSCYHKSGTNVSSDRYPGSDQRTGLYYADTKRLAAGGGLLWKEGGLFPGNV